MGREAHRAPRCSPLRRVRRDESGPWGTEARSSREKRRGRVSRAGMRLVLRPGECPKIDRPR